MWPLLIRTFLVIDLTFATILNGKCTDKHKCEVTITSQHPKVGFLTPKLCCDEIDFPFTFLANFFELQLDEEIVTLHMHEYYLVDIRVRVCEESFTEHYDSRTLSENTIFNMCMEYLHDDCHGYDAHNYQTYSHDTKYDISYAYSSNDLAARLLELRHLRDRPFSYPVYVNITIPADFELLTLPHDPYSSRDIFNITYEIRGVNESVLVPELSSYAYLQHCKYNGFPELHLKENGLYQYECRCMANSSGKTCEWGGDCPDATHKALCNHHGHCQYHRGKNVCVCDEDYFGQHCEYHESAAPEYKGKCSDYLQCEHTCHIAGRTLKCQCRAGYKLINETQCIEMDDLWDVTVKVQNYHQNISLKEKTHQILQEVGLKDLNLSVPPNSSKEEKVHFAVKNRTLVPDKSVWIDALQSPVNISYQNVLWIGPVKKEIRQANLVLICEIYGNLPLLIDWYKDQHHIYTFKVTSGFSSAVRNGIYTVKYYQKLSIKYHTVELWVKGHDPCVDWGSYTCQVANNDHQTVSRTVVSELTQPLQVEVLPYASRIEKNGSANLNCIVMADWDGGRHYKFSWFITAHDHVGHYFYENTNWNRSDIYIYGIKESVNVTCLVTVKENLCSPTIIEQRWQTVLVDVLNQQVPYCQSTTSYLTVWQATPAGQSDETICPEGFQGKAKQKCQRLSNQNPMWSTPDFSNCIYLPLLDILQNPELILQNRGYTIPLQNVTGLTEQLLHLIKNRDAMFLPGEHLEFLRALNQLFNPVNMPISLDVFLPAVQQIIMKMCTPTIADVWKLLNLIKTNIISFLKQHPPVTIYHEGDIMAKLATLQLESNTSFSINSRSHDQYVASLKVEVPTMEMDMQEIGVGAVMYLHPKKFLMGASMHAGQSVTNIPSIIVSAPIVEVMAVNLMNSTSSLNQALISHLSFLGYTTYTEALVDKNTKDYAWALKCGAAELKNNIVVWNLSRCTAHSQDESRDSYTCQCRGQALFGLVMVPSEITKPQLPDSDWGLTVVAGVCCVLAVLLILQCVWIMFHCSRATSDQHCLNMKRSVDSYLKRLRHRETCNTHRGVNIVTNQEQETLESNSNEEYYLNPRHTGSQFCNNSQATNTMYSFHRGKFVQSKAHTSNKYVGILQRRSNSHFSLPSGSRNGIPAENENRFLESHKPFTKISYNQVHGLHQEPIPSCNDTDDVYLDMSSNLKHKEIVESGGSLEKVHKYVNVQVNGVLVKHELLQNDASLQEEMPITTEYITPELMNPAHAKSTSELNSYLPMTVKKV